MGVQALKLVTTLEIRVRPFLKFQLSFSIVDSRISKRIPLIQFVKDLS